jgi:hypothetical protein
MRLCKEPPQVRPPGPPTPHNFNVLGRLLYAAPTLKLKEGGRGAARQKTNQELGEEEHEKRTVLLN